MTSLIGQNPKIAFTQGNDRDMVIWTDGKLGNWVMNTHTAGLGALALLSAFLVPFPLSWGCVAFAAIKINESLTKHPGDEWGDLGKITTVSHAFISPYWRSFKSFLHIG